MAIIFARHCSRQMDKGESKTDKVCAFTAFASHLGEMQHTETEPAIGSAGSSRRVGKGRRCLSQEVSAAIRAAVWTNTQLRALGANSLCRCPEGGMKTLRSWCTLNKPKACVMQSERKSGTRLWQQVWTLFPHAVGHHPQPTWVSVWIWPCSFTHWLVCFWEVHPSPFLQRWRRGRVDCGHHLLQVVNTCEPCPTWPLTASLAAT